MSNSILSVKNVIKRFSGTVALKGVDLELYPKEILALAGENGAGKSTLMKILSGIYPYGDYEGEIYIDGKLCKFRSPSDAEDAGIAMIYQELNLELDLTVGENILLGRYPKTKIGTINWKKVHTEAKKALDLLGVNINSKVTVRNLSPSMQQLVSIARALYRNPKILILDEPTSVLTEKETEGLMTILRGLRDKGISCIYISHKLDEIYELCDRTVVLRDGEKISEHRQCDGYDSAVIIEDMIGRHLDNMYPVRRANIGEEVLRAEHFRVAHPFAYGKSIVEDVSFSLRKGEILGLSGLVGSGRSELASAIFGAMPKQAGTLYLDGKEVNITSPAEAIKHGLGFLSEDRKKNGFIWTMSIKQNMTLVCLKNLLKAGFVDRKKEDEKATAYFEKLDVKAPSLDTQITNLSGGNQQKVILGRWLLTKPDVLLLDEPTRGIDVGAKYEIYQLMIQLAKEGKSIIMVSSEMPELLGVCDRIMVMSGGRVAGTVDAKSTTQEEIMTLSAKYV